MAIVSLVCEHCGGAIILDSSHQVGTCESCLSQYVIKEDRIVQHITQHVTKHVYGYAGKDVEELLADANAMMEAGDEEGANRKFGSAKELEPHCWEARLGYAETGGDRLHLLSMVDAYRSAYYVATTEEQSAVTFASMCGWIQDRGIRSAFVRAYNTAGGRKRDNIFEHVACVIGCDETEMARLAVDLCPNDWRTNLAMARVRQIRVKWSKPEGFFRPRWPEQTEEVFVLFEKAYKLANADSRQASEEVASYIDDMASDGPYAQFAGELKRRIDTMRRG